MKRFIIIFLFSFLFISCKTEQQDYVISQVVVDNVIVKPTQEYENGEHIYYIRLVTDEEFDLFYFLLKEPEKYVSLVSIKYDNDFFDYVNHSKKEQRLTFRTLQKGITRITLETKEYGVTGYEFRIF